MRLTEARVTLAALSWCRFADSCWFWPIPFQRDLLLVCVLLFIWVFVFTGLCRESKFLGYILHCLSSLCGFS